MPFPLPRTRSIIFILANILLAIALAFVAIDAWDKPDPRHPVPPPAGENV
jgi:hypothetical protein